MKASFAPMNRSAPFLVLLLCAFASPPAGADGGRCGPNTCAKGTTCCNRGCGICVPPGGACISLFCEWGQPRTLSNSENPTVGTYEQFRVSVSTVDSKVSFAGSEFSGRTGSALAMRMQRRLSDAASYRLGATASSLLSERGAEADERFGWSAAVGLSHRLPSIAKVVGLAATADAEFMDGAVAGNSLAPQSFGFDATATFGLGIAAEDKKNAVPVMAHARLLRVAQDRAASETYADVGIGVSTDFGWAFLPSGRPLPLGARLGYAHIRGLGNAEFREHEASGGLYYLGIDKTRLGMDLEWAHQHVSDEVSARRLGAMVRLDYYWDANF